MPTFADGDRRVQVRRLLEKAGFWTNDPDAYELDDEFRAARLVLRYRSEAHPDRVDDRQSFRDWTRQVGTSDGELLGEFDEEESEAMSLAQATRLVNWPNPEAFLAQFHNRVELEEERLIIRRRDALRRSDEIEELLAIPPHRRSKSQETALTEVGDLAETRWFVTHQEMKGYIDECLRVEGRLWLTPGGIARTASHVLGTLAMVVVVLVPILVWVAFGFLSAMLAALVCWWGVSIWAGIRAESSSERTEQWRGDWIARLKARLIQESKSCSAVGGGR